MSWRKYGFGDMDKDNPRATQPYKLSKAELKYMPNSNIHAERVLAKFSHLAVVAKFRNKKFTAKSIHNIILFQSPESVVDSIKKKNYKVLNNKEKIWNVDQKTLQNERIPRKKK